MWIHVTHVELRCRRARYTVYHKLSGAYRELFGCLRAFKVPSSRIHGVLLTFFRLTLSTSSVVSCQEVLFNNAYCARNTNIDLNLRSMASLFLSIGFGTWGFLFAVIVYCTWRSPPKLQSTIMTISDSFLMPWVWGCFNTFSWLGG